MLILVILVLFMYKLDKFVVPKFNKQVIHTYRKKLIKWLLKNVKGIISYKAPHVKYNYVSLFRLIKIRENNFRCISHIYTGC